jgi:threonine aldolase
MVRFIDLRSDTVTLPTQAMRDAMHVAEVGDDVYRDDPAVSEFEGLAADILGKEAALLVTSGTQGNIVCVMSHTRRGDAIVIGRDSHIAAHEAGSYAMLAGVSAQFPKQENGVMDPESIREMIRDDSELQEARTGLICVENAHSNGNVIPLGNMAEIYAIAKGKGIPVHFDGARAFNAAEVLGVGVKELTRHCDSVMCCASKGLCAPMGSVVAGSREFIARARKIRKALGGGMRQAGFVAEAARLALTEMPARLREDHENARELGRALSELPGVKVLGERLKINMVYFTVTWPQAFCAALPDELLKRGVKILPLFDGEFRFVTNKDVTAEDCGYVIKVLKELLAQKAQ